MTLLETVREYLNGQINPIKLIRTLSGMFNPDHAVSILALICAITRVEEGDVDKDTFWKIHMKQKDDWRNKNE